MTRIATAAALLLPAAAIICYGGAPLRLLSIAFFLALNYEYFSAFVFPSPVRRAVFTLLSFLQVLGYFCAGAAGALGGLVLCVVLAQSFLVIVIDRDPHEPRYDQILPAAMLGFCYTGLLGLILVIAANVTPGRHILWLILTVTIADSCAYFGGSSIGGTKLAPRVSPNKTVSGAACGIIAAGFGSPVCGWLLGLHFAPYVLFLFGLVVAVLAIFGDLSESMLKRAYGLKDTGSLLPGHGGLLDRLDALLFAAPVLFFLT